MLQKLKLLARKTYYTFLVFRTYYPDIKRSINVNYASLQLTQNQLLGILTVNYHVIEKGLSMSNFRPGFGTEKLLKLIDYCLLYINNKFDTGNFQFKHAVKVVNEYLKVHNDINFTLGQKLLDRIILLQSKSKITECSQQLKFTNDLYNNQKYNSFAQFASTRHSIRNFTSTEVPRPEIIKAIKVAQNSPSSCNRQPVKVYVIENADIKTWALEIQGGNRGFGHLINKVLVITVNIGFFNSFAERYEPIINAGLFAMTLMYAFQEQNIGTVPLAYTNFNAQNEALLRQKLQIADCETVCLFMGRGYLPENFTVASSPRDNVNNIISFI